MKTTVVNIYHKEDFDVYIGRAGHGYDGYFGNPNSQGSREDKLKLFKKYFYNRVKTDPEFRRRVLQLKGKRLGCFCSPKPCHGDIIAEYVNRQPECQPVKLAVVGSRTFNDYEYMVETLKWFDIKKIISGGARGADKCAERYAAEHGIDFQVFEANWDKFGKSAGYRRNVQIIEAADEVVAFWDGKSPGTQHDIQLAEERGKPVYIIKPRKRVKTGPIQDDEISTLG